MSQSNGKINLVNSEKPSTIRTPSNDFTSAYYLAKNPQYYEPQRNNTFKFVVSGLDKLIDLSHFGVTTDGSAENALELSVKASSVPHYEIEKVSINRGNSQMHFAGKPSFKDGSITVHDYIGAHTKEILLAWQRQAYNVETQKVGLANDYKIDATLYELTPDYQIIREWTLVGCWVSAISEGNYDHDSSDARTMDVTIVYDYAYIDTSSVTPVEQ